MGNTGGSGGVGGELGGGGGGGGGGGWFGGKGGKGGNGYTTEFSPAMIKDSEDTIFIWVDEKVSGEKFIDYAEQAGRIKTDNETALRLAEFRKNNSYEATKEGIVTYEKTHDVRKAMKILEDLQSRGEIVKFIPAGDYIKKKDIQDCYLTRKRGENTAWCFWRWQIDKHLPKGGQGGKGGDGFFGYFKGQDGEQGGTGPGGHGGKGGKGGGST